MRADISTCLAFALAFLALAAPVAAASAATPEGRWLAGTIRGGGVTSGVKSILEIAGDGTISGTGGCNRIVGKATITGSSISFGPLAGTMMACPQVAMDQERRFHAALAEVRSWRIAAGPRRLVLRDARGRALIRFSPLQAPPT